MLLALAAGLPGVIVSHGHDLDRRLHPEVAVDRSRSLIVGGWLAFAAAVQERVASPLRTLANLLEAMREGDYSIRARAARNEDALGDVMQQVNAMGTTLQAQRLGALEATTLLRKVMEEIDVAVFAFDSAHKLRLVNRAGERLLAQPSERLLNAAAEALGLGEYLDGPDDRTVQRAFPGERRALGRGPHVSSAKAACRTSSSSSPTSRAPSAKKSCRPGSAWSACSGTS